MGGNAFSCVDYTAIPCSPPRMCSWKLWWSPIWWAMKKFSCETDFLVITLFSHSLACVDLSSSEEDKDGDKSSERCSKKVPNRRGSSVTQMRQLRSLRTVILKAVLKRQCVLQLTVLMQLFMPLFSLSYTYHRSTFKTCIKSLQAPLLYFSRKQLL